MSIEQRILDAAVRVVEHEGLRGATTRRIAEEAGVNEVTLFRRFGSKEQLLLEAMRRRANEGPTLPESPADPTAELRAWCVRQADALWAARGFVRSALLDLQQHPTLCAAAHDHPQRVRAQLADYFDRLRACGKASGAWDADAIARMLLGALFSEAVTEPSQPEGGPFSAEAVADRYVPWVLRAIGISTRGNV